MVSKQVANYFKGRGRKNIIIPKIHYNGVIKVDIVTYIFPMFGHRETLFWLNILDSRVAKTVHNFFSMVFTAIIRDDYLKLMVSSLI